MTDKIEVNKACLKLLLTQVHALLTLLPSTDTRTELGKLKVVISISIDDWANLVK